MNRGITFRYSILVLSIMIYFMAIILTAVDQWPLDSQFGSEPGFSFLLFGWINVWFF